MRLKDLVAWRLLTVLVLGVVSDAQAECAWVLWQQQGQVNPNGSVFDYAWRWVVGEAYSTEAACRKALNTHGSPKDGPYSEITQHGVKLRARNVCLPDTVDPSGPKGGGQ